MPGHFRQGMVPYGGAAYPGNRPGITAPGDVQTGLPYYQDDWFNDEALDAGVIPQHLLDLVRQSLGDIDVGVDPRRMNRNPSMMNMLQQDLDRVPDPMPYSGGDPWRGRGGPNDYSDSYGYELDEPGTPGGFSERDWETLTANQEPEDWVRMSAGIDLGADDEYSAMMDRFRSSGQPRAEGNYFGLDSWKDPMYDTGVGLSRMNMNPSDADPSMMDMLLNMFIGQNNQPNSSRLMGDWR